MRSLWRYVLVAAAVVAASLVLTACDEEEEEGQGTPTTSPVPTAEASPVATPEATPDLTPSPQATATLEPTPEVTPTTATSLADYTGIPEVDAIVEAVLSQEPEALRPLVRFTTRPCFIPPQGIIPPDMAGEPVCLSDEAKGTPVEFVPATIGVGQATRCEPGYFRPDEIENLLATAAFAQASLYAVYRPAPPTGTSSRYGAIFAGSYRGEPFGAELVIEDGQVVRVNFGCADRRTPAELAELVEPQDFVLPPREP